MFLLNNLIKLFLFCSFCLLHFSSSLAEELTNTSLNSDINLEIEPTDFAQNNLVDPYYYSEEDNSQNGGMDYSPPPVIDPYSGAENPQPYYPQDDQGSNYVPPQDSGAPYESSEPYYDPSAGGQDYSPPPVYDDEN